MSALLSKRINFTLPAIILVILVMLVLFAPDTLLAETAVDAEKVGEGGWFQSILWTFVNGFFGFFVWIAGSLLNLAVGQFVVGFGDLFKSQGLGFAVDHLWTLVRDIFNLTFIFGLVYIGFKMILRIDDSNARRMLVHIVLAALLVNFSLFFAKAVVDFSNIAATQVAQAFYDGGTGEYKVADAFMNVLGLSSIWGADGSSLTNVAEGKNNGYGYIFGTMVIFIITAFVFFAGAILLLIRFAVLNIYLILSPIMFIGWVFPGMGSYASQYWSNFLARAFFAPAYLLMLYFAYYILKEFNGLMAGSKESYALIFLGGEKSAQAINILPYFFITCIFLLAAVVVAQKMGGDAANWTISNTKRVGMGSLKKVGMGVSYPLRYSAQAMTRNLVVNRAGSGLEKGFNKLQTKTSDSKYNPLKWHAVDRKVQSVAKTLKEAELGTGTTNLKETAYEKGLMSRVNQNRAESERKDDFTKANEVLSQNTGTTAELTKAFEDLSKSIKSMSSIEKERLGIDKLKSEHIAANLTDSDIDSLEKTGSFSTQQIKDIKTARNNSFINIAKTGNTFGANSTNPNAQAVNIRESMFYKKNVKDIGKLPIEVFQNQAMYEHITPAMLEEKLKEGTPKKKEREEMRKALSDHLQINVNDRPEAQVLGKDNPWVKWANGNSTHAAQFFS
jgi:hypothetical protein